MKVRHLHQQLSPALNHPSTLLIALRHGKIMINTLLRWGSAGLLSSYILTIIAGIHLYNQLILTSGWMASMLLSLFFLLFICLLCVQYRYSEKRTEKLPVNENDIKLNSFYVRDRYKTYQRFIGSYVTANFISCLLMTFIHFPAKHMVMGIILISGLALYGFGLFMIRGLLMEKLAIRQMINKISHYKN